MCVCVYIFPGLECLANLTTRKSCDITKQSICGWQYIYIYISLNQMPWHQKHVPSLISFYLLYKINLFLNMELFWYCLIRPGSTSILISPNVEIYIKSYFSGYNFWQNMYNIMLYCLVLYWYNVFFIDILLIW